MNDRWMYCVDCSKEFEGNFYSDECPYCGSKFVYESD